MTSASGKFVWSFLSILAFVLAIVALIVAIHEKTWSSFAMILIFSFLCFTWTRKAIPYTKRNATSGRA